MAEIIGSFWTRLISSGMFQRLPGWLWNRQVKTTREGYLFMALLIAVGAAATNTGNNLLYLVLAMMFAVLFASFLLSEYAIENLHLERELPRRVHVGTEFVLIYRLTNRKRRWTSWAILVEEHPEASETGGIAALFVQVPAGKTETASAHYRPMRRGRLRWDRVTLSTRYPFGFFIKSKTVRLPGQVVVYPALVEVRPELQAPPAGTGPILTRRRGSGSEVWNFRNYQPGDCFRWIHWKTTARRNRLMVREQEAEQERRVRIKLQVNSLRPADDDPGREAAISEAASLSYRFLAADYWVRLEVNGRGVDFGQGPEQMHRLWHFLALFDDAEDPDPGAVLSPEQNFTGWVVELPAPSGPGDN